jgi:uncharacterized protein YndB with AHSA1/START domain
MRSHIFDLVSEWRIEAPVDRVWQVLADIDAWPDWWPSVSRVELVDRGGASGLGAVRRINWRTALPYGLVIDMQMTRLEPPILIEGRADGALDGLGRWRLRPCGNGTLVRYEWTVEIAAPWMRRLAPLLRPAYSWNHKVVMDRGRRGLASRVEAG